MHCVSLLTKFMCTDSRSNHRSLLFSAVLSPEVIGPSLLTSPTHNLTTRWVCPFLQCLVNIVAMTSLPWYDTLYSVIAIKGWHRIMHVSLPWQDGVVAMAGWCHCHGREKFWIDVRAASVKFRSCNAWCVVHTERSSWAGEGNNGVCSFSLIQMQVWYHC